MVEMLANGGVDRGILSYRREQRQNFFMIIEGDSKFIGDLGSALRGWRRAL